jgi:hypothetical protein
MDKLNEVSLKNARILTEYPNDPYANEMLGMLSQYYNKDYTLAEEYYRRALLNAPQEQTQQILDSFKDPGFKQAVAQKVVQNNILEPSTDDSWQLAEAVAKDRGLGAELARQFDDYIGSLEMPNVNNPKEMVAETFSRLLVLSTITYQELARRSNFLDLTEPFTTLAKYEITFNKEKK